MAPFNKRDLRMLGFGAIFGSATCFIGYSVATAPLAYKVVSQERTIRDLNDTLDKELPWYKRLPSKIAPHSP